MNHLVESLRFQGMIRLFVLAFEDDVQRTGNEIYYLPNVEIKDYNVMIDGKNVFDQPVKNSKITYENIRKIFEEAKETVLDFLQGTVKLL